MATQIQAGECCTGSRASASRSWSFSPSLRTAKSSSNWTLRTGTSCSRYCEKVVRWSAASPSQAKTVLGSTSNTSALAPDNHVIQTVNVNHNLGARQIDILNWIVNHVNNRHTFEHFDFGDPGVLGRHTSTLFLS